VPLTPAIPTTAALRSLEEGLRGIARRGLPAPLARAHARLAVRSVVATHRGVRLYDMRLEDVAGGHSPAEVARAVGWRFFIPGLRLGQSAEVRRLGRRFEMSRWSEGPDNRRFFELVTQLNGGPCARKRYQLRCLEIPALHLMAVWAYRSETDQWFVPVSLLPTSLTSGHTIDGPTFNAALTTKATDRLASRPSSLA
jgi:hypothetical protein